MKLGQDKLKELDSEIVSVQDKIKDYEGILERKLERKSELIRDILDDKRFFENIKWKIFSNIFLYSEAAFQTAETAKSFDDFLSFVDNIEEIELENAVLFCDKDEFQIIFENEEDIFNFIVDNKVNIDKNQFVDLKDYSKN